MKISAYNRYGIEVYLCSFFNLGTGRDEGQLHIPPTFPQGKTQYLLCRMLGGPQGRFRRVRKISTQPNFEPQTVQPVASEHTN